MDPYNWSVDVVLPMSAYDNASPLDRRMLRASADQWEFHPVDYDHCLTDDVIPTRPRNRMRPLVRSLT